MTAQHELVVFGYGRMPGDPPGGRGWIHLFRHESDWGRTDPVEKIDLGWIEPVGGLGHEVRKWLDANPPEDSGVRCIQVAGQHEKFFDIWSDQLLPAIGVRGAARIAREGALVAPDGGAPTEEERALCERIARRIERRACRTCGGTGTVAAEIETDFGPVEWPYLGAPCPDCGETE